jgi:hypothetical protein
MANNEKRINNEEDVDSDLIGIPSIKCTVLKSFVALCLCGKKA